MKNYRVQAVYSDGIERTLNLQYPNNISAVIEFSMTAKVTDIETWLMIDDHGQWLALDGQFIQ